MVEFKNVSMSYEKGHEVLKNISFKLEPGSMHFLTGPSGSGKTSLLKLIYLAQKPSYGEILMFNRDVAKVKREDLPALRRRIGVVFQDFRLLDHMSAVHNVALPLRIAGASFSEVSEHVEELLSWVGLGDKMNSNPTALSGGEKQRVAIARAVIRRPDIIVADEPTGNVDPKMAERLMYLFVELNKLGTTIVIATHDDALVAKVGAPRLHLIDGKLLQVKGSKEDISEFIENEGISR
ncbi:MAG: cell division ATP-binding protein FtsE [Kordiimonadaceae bacterium]|nr:cell division ATP-binding protein FtsE [Kordiimonadaceae bacterium]MDC0081688.1 cell division ATP-binding protein FtsE [Emcibacteraceae bacterium]MBT6466512.1 cell division ATP-binding protein FtsE [Kordiimonadaceae bacterium]MBT7545775.1 cell division ATP-binding protein FtsE [Kordiimonadaceae bacterium]MBT7606046.1 cell division ATP-binding protein FtsE [Kordiimonadaceae bacterium]